MGTTWALIILVYAETNMGESETDRILSWSVGDEEAVFCPDEWHMAGDRIQVRYSNSSFSILDPSLEVILICVQSHIKVQKRTDTIDLVAAELLRLPDDQWS